ncbi:hypothetical protein [Flavobacterium chungnamense]|uniref:DUF4163 domain-containing protein n=1 Tax=Flavobacterium chungnamense TaxID=706182 RepID=A0ABP7V0J3_9FLAO
MKKILSTIALSLLLFSCKQENKNEIKNDYSEIFNSKELLDLKNTITEPKEKYNFYKHLYLVTTFEDLKKSDDKDLSELKNYSDKTLMELSTIINDEYISNGKDEDMDSIPSYTGLFTRNQITTKLDSVFSTKKYDLSAVMHETFVGTLNGGTRIASIKNNVVTIEREFGTGASLFYTNVLVENNKVTNLGQVYDYLRKSEYDKLENEIYKINTNFRDACYRECAKIEKTKNNTNLISFTGYANDDAGCCPTFSISYETIDFITIIPNSVKVKVQK